MPANNRHRYPMRTLLVTGGAGFIGGNFVRLMLSRPTPHRQPRQADLRRQPRHPGRRSRTTRGTLRPGRHRRPDLVANCCASTRSTPSSTSPPRATSTAPSTARPRSSRPTSSAPSTCSTAPAPTGAASPSNARRRSASCTSPPTRSTAPSARPAPSPRPRLRPQLALLRLQGRVRPPGAGLAPHLRPAGADHQLLEQLRPLPVPGEADPADDRQGPRRRAAAHLRRRRQRARLALRRGPLPRHRARAGGRPPGEVYNVGGNSEKTNLEVVDTLCALLDEALPDSPHRPHAQLKQFVTDRPGHDQRYAIDATKLKRELGWEPTETFETGMNAPCAGTSTTSTGRAGQGRQLPRPAPRAG
jgi:hypothetical protein